MFKPGINYRQMAEQQERDTETNAYGDSVTNLQWTEVEFLYCVIHHTSTGRPRPLVSRDTRRAVVNIMHSLSHPSIRLTIELVPVATRRFCPIHVDIVGPLPPSNEMRYLFTVTDRSTRWLEATPMPDATTETCVYIHSMT